MSSPTYVASDGRTYNYAGKNVTPVSRGVFIAAIIVLAILVVLLGISTGVLWYYLQNCRLTLQHPPYCPQIVPASAKGAGATRGAAPKNDEEGAPPVLEA